MVSFSIKPGNQNDETESPNLVNKLANMVNKLFFLLAISCSEKFQMEGVLTDLKQQEIKELLECCLLKT